jgi:hypothetical protein
MTSFLKAAFKLYEMFDSAIWDSDGTNCHVIVKSLFAASGQEFARF